MTGHIGGAPGERYAEFRCKATANSTGEQCNKFAMVGEDYCRTHRGRFATRGRQIKTTGKLPQMYRRLGRKLREVVTETLGEPVDVQLSLTTELAVVRALCDDAIGMYEAAQERADELDEGAKSGAVAVVNNDLQQRASKLRQLSVAGLREAIDHVRETCVDAARVRQAIKGIITPQDIQHVLNQVVTIMYTVCGDDNAKIAEEFERRVGEVELLDIKSRGSNLRPGDDMSAMDRLTLGLEET